VSEAEPELGDDERLMADLLASVLEASTPPDVKRLYESMALAVETAIASGRSVSAMVVDLTMRVAEGELTLEQAHRMAGEG
jgi:hypothetical protein